MRGIWFQAAASQNKQLRTEEGKKLTYCSRFWSSGLLCVPQDGEGEALIKSVGQLWSRE